MKVLLDMNLSPKLANLLIEKGIESVHWFYIGAPDAKVLNCIIYAGAEVKINAYKYIMKLKLNEGDARLNRDIRHKRCMELAI